MKLYKCDQCKTVFDFPDPKIYLKGYYPRNAAGILIPENCREFEFCTHDCFVAYMRWAITKEPCVPSNSVDK